MTDLTREEIIRGLDALTHADREMEHVDADELLLKAVEELGGHDIAMAYRQAKARVGFWYT